MVDKKKKITKLPDGSGVSIKASKVFNLITSNGVTLNNKGNVNNPSNKLAHFIKIFSLTQNPHVHCII